MPLYIVEKLMDGVMLLDLRGSITLGEETEALRSRIRQLIEAGYLRIILDLEEITYIDSVGLSTLVASCASARKVGGDLKLLRLPRGPGRLLQITRLSTVFEIYDNLEDVRHSFNREPSP